MNIVSPPAIINLLFGGFSSRHLRGHRLLIRFLLLLVIVTSSATGLLHSTLASIVNDLGTMSGVGGVPEEIGPHYIWLFGGRLARSFVVPSQGPDCYLTSIDVVAHLFHSSAPLVDDDGNVILDEHGLLTYSTPPWPANLAMSIAEETTKPPWVPGSILESAPYQSLQTSALLTFNMSGNTLLKAGHTYWIIYETPPGSRVGFGRGDLIGYLLLEGVLVTDDPPVWVWYTSNWMHGGAWGEIPVAGPALRVIVTPVPVPQISITDTDDKPMTGLSFGDTVVPGASASKVIKIFNSGEASLDANIKISGRDQADFSVDIQGAFTVPAGLSQTVNVTFSPHTSGFKVAYVLIYHNAANQGNPIQISASGGRRDPDIFASSLAWPGAQNPISFSVGVSFQDLPVQTTAALFWSQYTMLTDSSTLAYSIPFPQAIATYQFSVPPSALAVRPPDAKYLLLVVDPPSAALPKGLVVEDSENNNVRSISLSADLALTMTGVPNPVIAGQPLTYTIHVTNQGFQPAPDQYVDVYFAPELALDPNQLTFTADPSTVLSYDPSTSFANFYIPGPLPVGQGITITITANVGNTIADGTQIETDVVAYTYSDELDYDNNYASMVVKVGGPKISVTMTVAPPPVKIGDEITYSIIVQNTGSATANSIVVKDTMPNSLQYVPGSIVANGADTVTDSTTEPSVTYSALAAGNSKTFTLMAKAADYVIVNKVSANWSGDDGTTADVTTLLPPDVSNASVGSHSIYLNWSYPETPGPDEFIVQVASLDVSTKQYTDIGQVSIPPLNDGTGWRVRFSGSFPTATAFVSIVDDTSYRLRLAARKGMNFSAWSEEFYFLPGVVGVEGARKPQAPLVFLHGFLGDAGTFADTADFLRNTLGWRDGGIIQGYSGAVVAGDYSLSQILNPHGDFYRVEFGSSWANYADNTGITHQGWEVWLVLRSLLLLRAIFPDENALDYSIVAHSNGGLAGRTFLAEFFDGNTDYGVPSLKAMGVRLQQFVTYGTPHRGADGQGVADRLLSCDQLPSSFTSWFNEWISASRVDDWRNGATDAMLTGCSGTRPDLSEFLNRLNTEELPQGPDYTAIISTFLGFHGCGTTRADDCLSHYWDGLVPTDSQNMKLVTSRPVRVVGRNRFHAGEGNDFSGILYALNPNGIWFAVMSPVDIEVTAPDGRVLAPRIAGIPGASYEEAVDESGHLTANAIIPFPLPGEYKIHVTQKPGGLAMDTYTILVTQNGVTTTIAQNTAIQNIPSEGYSMIAGKDTEKPVIKGCPANLTVDNDIGNFGAKVSWVEPTATDNVDVTSFTSNHKPNETFPVGATTVNYMASDAAGNTATCSFTVTVRLKGDLDGDGKVDQNDLTILLTKIRARSTDLTYDLNGDGKVDIADARFLVLHFSNPGGAPSGTAK